MTRQELVGVLNDYQIVEIDKEKETLTIVGGQPLRFTRICVPEAVREAVTEQELREILDGKRECMMLDVLSRVVGYYAFQHNMGKSRLAEVLDRRKADYSF